MSLYTPVFPPYPEPGGPRKDLSENSQAVTAKQQSYTEFLRDVHLFLSTQNDMLSPPSRPNSPLFDRRVQKVRDEIQDAFSVTKGEAPSGKWTRISQTLKLGCVRGRPWSVSKIDPCAPEENTKWILPDEESEWMEWEKKREESRRLKGKTNVVQHIGSAPLTVAGTSQSVRASFTGLRQLGPMTRERPPRCVSPTTLRAAKEKVRKWQASVAPGLWHDTTSASSSTSIRAPVATTPAEHKIDKPQRSRTLDFAVVKPAAKSIIGKREKRASSRPAIWRGSALASSHESKSPELSKASNIPEVTTTSADADKAGSERLLRASPIKDDKLKIADVPETPYLPPSFPEHLETSTPLAGPIMPVRAKPPAILPVPASSPTPPQSGPANSSQDHQLAPLEHHKAKLSSPPPPQIDTARQEKRTLGFSMPLNDSPDGDPLVTPPAKRLRTLSQNSNPVSKHSRPRSPNGGLNSPPDARDDAQDPGLGSAPSYRYNIDSFEMTSGALLASGKNDQLVTGADAQRLPEKVSSPTKSAKSYFSAPDSDSADSPMRTNLLLESPVSPMLSYAQNPSGFLPQITSTQRKGSPTADRTNNDHNGIFGMGYSSQFDVERHVDRVNELLEKDVDFDGWLRDVRTSRD